MFDYLFEKSLHFKRKKFEILKQLAAENDIIASENTMRRVVKRWQLTGNFLTKN